jgi:hypothetical protein
MITNEYLSWRRGRSARVVQLTDEVLEGLLVTGVDPGRARSVGR